MFSAFPSLIYVTQTLGAPVRTANIGRGKKANTLPTSCFTKKHNVNDFFCLVSGTPHPCEEWRSPHIRLHAWEGFIADSREVCDGRRRQRAQCRRMETTGLGYIRQSRSLVSWDSACRLKSTYWARYPGIVTDAASTGFEKLPAGSQLVDHWSTHPKGIGSVPASTKLYFCSALPYCFSCPLYH